VDVAAACPAVDAGAGVPERSEVDVPVAAAAAGPTVDAGAGVPGGVEVVAH
jgi:hypothetical protein